MKGLSRKNKKRFILSLTLLVVFSIPLVVFTLITTNSFDTSSKASLREGNQCEIKFKNVNPNSVEVGSKLQIEIVAESPVLDGYVDTIILNSSEKTDAPLFTKSYAELKPKLVTENFIFTAEKTGAITIDGQLSVKSATGEVTTYDCVFLETIENQIRALDVNKTPEFTTDAQKDSLPSTEIKVGDTYKYVLKASDNEDDKIEYNFSFTPGADWLKMTPVVPGTAGELELSFDGVPTIPAAYLANVFIHDGYSSHLRSQSWVISVEQRENDIPKVVVLKPIDGFTLTQGAILEINWQATDLNQIVQYRIYYAENPANRASWKVINENVGYQVGTYLFDTKVVPEGQYKIIVEAVDNQTPAAVGQGVSGTFVIKPAPITTPDPNDNGNGEDDDDTDDGIVFNDPQITAISPDNKSELQNRRPTISATLVAGKDATIVADSIVFKLNGKDLTSNLEINEISDSEFRIIYKPVGDLELGEQKIELTFEDTNENPAEREWTFTVIEEEAEDVWNILGFEISRRLGIIILVGLGLLLLALIIPWLLYLAWRDSDDDESDVYYQAPYQPANRPNLNSSNPTTNSYYTTPSGVGTTNNSYSTETKTPVYTPTINTSPASNTLPTATTSTTSTTLIPSGGSFTTAVPLSGGIKPAETAVQQSTSPMQSNQPPINKVSVVNSPNSATVPNGTTQIYPQGQTSSPQPMSKPIPVQPSQNQTSTATPVQNSSPTPPKSPIAFPPDAKSAPDVKPKNQESNADSLQALAELIKKESDDAKIVDMDRKPQPTTPNPSVSAPQGPIGVAPKPIQAAPNNVAQSPKPVQAASNNVAQSPKPVQAAPNNVAPAPKPVQTPPINVTPNQAPSPVATPAPPSQNSSPKPVITSQPKPQQTSITATPSPKPITAKIEPIPAQPKPAEIGNPSPVVEEKSKDLKALESLVENIKAGKSNKEPVVKSDTSNTPQQSNTVPLPPTTPKN